jgi:hypothetical protein
MITVAIVALLVSGCATAAVSHSVPGVALRVLPGSTNASQSTVHLASHHPNDPAWLTGELEIDSGLTLASPTARMISAAQSVSLDQEFSLVNTSAHSTLGDDSSVQKSDALETRLFPCSLPPLVEPSIFSRIASDHRHFYSPDSLLGLSYGLAGGALMANTNFDQAVQNRFQASVHNKSNDSLFRALHAPKELGNGYRTVGIYAATWAAGALLEGHPVADDVGEWGERSFRSILVGAPPMLATQYVIGGSRPGESTSGSDWKLLNDHNGVSGHAFMGAVPFLTAAQMTEEPWLKLFLYVGSTLVPLSRVNDDDHYTSQAFLGWWFAVLATKAIDSGYSNDSSWNFAPWLAPGTSGFAIEHRF